MLIKRHYFPLARLALVIALITITTLALMPVEEIPFPQQNDKLQHIAAFLALSFLLDACQPQTAFSWKKGAILLAYGILLEFLQKWAGYRFFSLWDIAADLTGILLYAVSIPLLRQIPLINWRWKLSNDPEHPLPS